MRSDAIRTLGVVLTHAPTDDDESRTLCRS
jgi:hypothetical protein